MELKHYLASKNLTPAEFGASVGQSESAVKKWLRSERTPRAETLMRIREVTKGEVTPDDFFPKEAA